MKRKSRLNQGYWHHLPLSKIFFVSKSGDLTEEASVSAYKSLERPVYGHLDIEYIEDWQGVHATVLRTFLWGVAPRVLDY